MESYGLLPAVVCGDSMALHGRRIRPGGIPSCEPLWFHANVPTVKTRLSRARAMLLASLEKSKHLQFVRAA